MAKHRDDGLKTRIDARIETPEPPLPTPLTRELTRVEEANFAFYDAFHRRDIAKMERLWSPSPHVRCVHPGWEPVVGWSDIRQSWVDIFRTMKSIEFSLEDVHVAVAGDTAWVNLMAHAEIETEDEEQFTTSVCSTTIFEKTDGRWQIVLHHASHFADEDEVEGEEELDMETGDIALDTSGGEKPN
ncbi:MAG: nuclear transport factor 2 family protein [Deltaproteobacteria bacterium]|nr:nuclear transport factor 2 family protein [Deltaproteobacteria bacterium]